MKTFKEELIIYGGERSSKQSYEIEESILWELWGTSKVPATERVVAFKQNT